MGPWFMTLLLVAGWGLFIRAATRRWKLLMVGAAESRTDNVGERLKRTWTYGLAQLRMRRYPIVGFAHMLIFAGFGVLLLRTLILWGRGFDESFSFGIFGHDWAVGRIYSFLKDIFAVLVLIGALVFLYYRVIKRPQRMTLSTEGLIIILIIVVMMLADIFYDGATIAGHAQTQASTFQMTEPAGSLAAMILSGCAEGSLTIIKHVGFWTHSALVLIFLNLLPYSKHFHVITAIPNVYAQSLHPPGRLPPIEDIDGKLEREETLGIKRIDQFSWKSILDFYTCTECGRCSDHCPATKTGKKLSPKHFGLDLRDFLYKHQNALVAANAAPSASSGSGNGESGNAGEAEPLECHQDLVGPVIDPEVLWACTSCRACETECPVFITFVDKITDMRRYLVQEKGEFPSELQTAFRSLESAANPWGFPAEDRAAWAEGLGVKTIAEHPEAEYLLWVGCAPSYDERAKKVTRATVKLFQKAGVDFAILGTEEQCTGDPARRAGNEYLFQMFAKANVEV
ncbi:MAG: (Fe-S)-binding protein, partial [bacterium]|nr:(Fe-S)-binding protein [bacterium]